MDRSSRAPSSKDTRHVRPGDDRTTSSEQRSMRPSLQSQPRLSSSLKIASTPSASPPHDEADSPLSGTVTPTPSVDSPASVKTVVGHNNTYRHRVQTPSYAFPGSYQNHPIAAYAPQHQSFMDLSPTGSPAVTHPGASVFERKQSTASTPQTSMPFRPFEGQVSQSAHEQDSQFTESRYPAPSLYDVVLKINSDPRLRSWWTTVTDILRESFHSERAVLSIPVDATDMESVPWVLRGVYDESGLRHRLQTIQNRRPASDDDRKLETAGLVRSLSATKSKGNRRPGIDTRHSYAGYETTRRTTSETVHNLQQLRPPKGRSGESQTGQLGKFTTGINSADHMEDEEKSSEHSNHTKAAVFTHLRPLSSEQEPLVEPSHVSRVLMLNKTLVLTRNYAVDGHAAIPEEEIGHTAPGHSSGSNDSEMKTFDPRSKRRRVSHSRNIHQHAGLFGSNRFLKATRYEEVEQIPPSPWSHSPAPSPAIQAEPDENPFFASANVEEDTFSPKQTDEDYSRLGPVEAIGVDKASTVIHLPLFHPLLSSFTSASETHPGHKAPIAILSILSNIVPYPQGLLDSIKHLGDHLATSYHTSCQLLHHDSLQNFQPRSSPATSYADEPSSPRDSQVASPSRSSMYSRQSSANSNLASPTPANIITPAKPARGPSDYFEQGGERPNQRRSLNHRKLELSATGLSGVNDSSGDGVGSLDSVLDKPISIPTTPEHGTRVLQPQTLHEHSNAAEDESRGAVTTATSSEKPILSESAGHETAKSKPPKGKSILHSNGADFGATFQTLPSTASHNHQRKSSADQVVPPPSEKLLRLIIDAAPIQMLLTEPVTGKLNWFNTKFLVYHGLSEQELLEDPHRSIHPRDRPQYVKAWKTSLATGQQFQHKVRLLRFDGKYLWFFMRAVPLRDTSHKIVHWLGTAIDINDHLLAEAETLKQKSKAAANAKYRALADSCPQITFTATRNNGITLCNNQWLLYSGQAEDQALGIGFIDHVHPDDLKKCRLPSADGVNIRMSEVPLSVGLKTRRKLNRSSSGVTDTSGEEDNKAVATPTNLTQTRLSELAETGILQVKKNEVGRVEYDTEVRLKNRVGAYRWHMVKVVLADSSASVGAGQHTWFGSCSDIHDHKELAIKLKHAMEAKSRFLSNMSHEMRTPLNGISGNISLMSGTTLTDEQVDFLNAVRSSAEGLQQLVNDVLDFSKAEAGMMKLQLEKFHVRSIVEDVNDTIAVKAMEKSLELNFIVEENVPVTVVGDKGRLRQILWNIVNNALKFTSEGEVLVHCETVEDEHPLSPMRTADQKDPQMADAEESIMIQFTVSDTGAGFSEEDKVKLFQRFSQIDGSSTRQHGGTGLGLVISKALVELHGGSMSAEGQPGKGAQFMFSIKVGHVDSNDGASLKPSIWRGHPSSPDLDKQLPASASRATFGSALCGTDLHDSPQPYEQKGSVASSSSGGGSMASTSTAPASTSASSYDHPHTHTPSKSADGIPSDAIGQPPIVITAQSSPSPILCNVLIASPLRWTAEATSHHVKSVAPTGVPVHVTQEYVFAEARKLLLDAKLVFSHAILYHDNTQELAAVLEESLLASHLARACIMVLCDPGQKRALLDQMWNKDAARHADEHRLGFLLKPLKPSKLAPFFDPSRSREMSLDHNQHSAQRTVQDQRDLYARVKDEWAGRGVRVLIVEDNVINVGVIKGFFKKVNITAEIAYNGDQCTRKVFEHDPAYYSIILCDIQMPHKDGLQTCREIREWEQQNNSQTHLPVIALSANVLGKVSKQCEEVGFDHYLEKPIDYAKLAAVMTELLGNYRR